LNKSPALLATRRFFYSIAARFNLKNNHEVIAAIVESNSSILVIIVLIK